MAGPRIWRNRWRSLEVPPLGTWTPELAVTVVVPSYRNYETLPLTLASLAGQSYPTELMDVVVVDDGSDPPLVLPDVHPKRCRLLRAEGGWACAHATNVGVEAATGDVVLYLDADMIVDRHHVEAQMRWHHQLDHAVVLGEKTFIDPADGLPEPAELARATVEGRTSALLADRWSMPRDWVEEFYARNDDLDRAAWRAYRVHVGTTASVARDLYLAVGGNDPALKLGEDIELGHRLAQKGAVFLPDRESLGWHVGLSNQQRRNDVVRRHNDPYFADRCPDLRYLRQSPGRTYAVPLVEVVVDATEQPYEAVRHTVDAVLAGQPSDVACVVIGPWSTLTDERRQPLDDPLIDLRLVQAAYASESRCRLQEERSGTAFPAPFRLFCPAGLAPEGDTLGRLVDDLQGTRDGLVELGLPDGTTVRLERTAAVERALRVRESGDDIDDVVAAVAGRSRTAATGFRTWDGADSP